VAAERAVLIRDERPTDVAAIRAVVAAAFGRPLEGDLVERLRADGDAVLSLVAVEGGESIGHVLLSRLAAPFPALALAPLAVLPAQQRTGIGGRLVRTALARATAEGWQAVLVVGEPAYYRRFGFDPGLAAGFACAYAGPYLMALALQGDLPTTAGRIDYPPAFAALGD
jgi:putative acetyltransferase